MPTVLQTLEAEAEYKRLEAVLQVTMDRMIRLKQDLGPVNLSIDRARKDACYANAILIMRRGWII
jgi:hypothetical protein